MSYSKKIGFFIAAIVLTGYFVLIISKIEWLSQNVLIFARFHVDVDPYKEFLFGLLTYIGLSLITALYFRTYLIFWLVKGFITIFLLIWREALRPFDSAAYYGFGVYNIEEYIFGSGGTATVMHINHFFSYIVGNSYYSIKMLNSFIGFLGIILFYKSFVYIMKKSNLPNIESFKYWIFLLPSILLWTSNIGKDPLIFFSVGLFTLGAIHLIDKMNPINFSFIFIAMFLSIYIRPWYPMIMIMALSFYYTNFRSFRSIFLLIIFSPILYMLFQMMLQFFGIYSFEDIFLRMTGLATGFSRGGSSVEVGKITGIGSYLYYFVPNIFTSLFRPMPFEVRNLGMLLSSLENVLLLYLFVRYVLGNFRVLLKNKYLKFLLLFLFAWLLLYVIPQGNLGTTVRFKVQILPILIMIAYISKELSSSKRKSIGSTKV